MTKRYSLLSNKQHATVYRFLESQDYSAITEEQRWHSYHCWGRGGNRMWSRVAMGGTMQMCALMWYHHLLKPGSKEIRPRVIYRALVRACGLEPDF